MVASKVRDKGHNDQTLTEAAKARWQTMERVEDATTNQLWQRQAAAGNESKRTAAGNGWQMWAAAVDNRVDNCTMTAGTKKNGQQEQSR